MCVIPPSSTVTSARLLLPVGGVLQLTLEGPDGNHFEASEIPPSTRPYDLATSLFWTYHEGTGLTPIGVPSEVTVVRTDTRAHLDPNLSLVAQGVTDGACLAVSWGVTAGVGTEGLKAILGDLERLEGQYPDCSSQDYDSQERKDREQAFLQQFGMALSELCSLYQIDPYALFRAVEFPPHKMDWGWGFQESNLFSLAYYFFHLPGDDGGQNGLQHFLVTVHQVLESEGRMRYPMSRELQNIVEDIYLLFGTSIPPSKMVEIVRSVAVLLGSIPLDPNKLAAQAGVSDRFSFPRHERGESCYLMAKALYAGISPRGDQSTTLRQLVSTIETHLARRSGMA